MLKRLAHSLSFRLLVIFLIMGLLFAYGAILGIRWVYATDQLRELVSGHLSLHIDYVKRDIGNPPSIDNALRITEKVPVDIRLSGPTLEWASDPAFPAVSQLTFGRSEVFSSNAATWLRGLEDVEFATSQGHSFLRIRQGQYAIIVSSPKIADVAIERQLTPIIMGFGLFLVLLAYLAVRWLFKPIEKIRLGAAQIGRGNFSHRIDTRRNDELGDLASDINTMATDVQQMLDAKRQLLLGISHELRTPLSRMKLAIELAEQAPGLTDMSQDVAEMSKIIDTLLEAERLNSRHAALHISRIPVGRWMTDLINDFFPRDRQRLTIKHSDDFWLNADEARLTLLLKNLIANALRYSSATDGKIAVEFSTTTQEWQIVVRDHGPGIAADQMDFIGEPFFRGDASRTRRTGGSGLGLYIVKLIAEAHGGTLTLDRTWATGACFIVKLPFEPGLPQ